MRRVALFLVYWIVLTIAVQHAVVDPGLFLILMGLGVVGLVGPLRLLRFGIGALLMARGL